VFSVDIGDAREEEKCVKSEWIHIYAANLVSIACLLTLVYRCANILAQEYPFFILIYILYLTISIPSAISGVAANENNSSAANNLLCFAY
jgi:hypothetical protein